MKEVVFSSKAAFRECNYLLWKILAVLLSWITIDYSSQLILIFHIINCIYWHSGHLSPVLIRHLELAGLQHSLKGWGMKSTRLLWCGSAPLTGVSSVVLGVFLQLVYVHLHSRPGRTLHHAVDVLSCQGQCQPLPTPTHGLVIQDCR